MGGIVDRSAGAASVGEDKEAGVLPEDRADAGGDLLHRYGTAARRYHQTEIVVVNMAGKAGIDNAAVALDELHKCIGKGLAQVRHRARRARSVRGMARRIGIIANGNVMDEPNLPAMRLVLAQFSLQPVKHDGSRPDTVRA